MFFNKNKQLLDTENKLSELQWQLDSINRNVAEIRFRPDGSVIYASNIFLEMLGYKLEEIAGQHHRIFCEKNYASTADYSRFWQKLADGHPQSGLFRRLRKDGINPAIKYTKSCCVGDTWMPEIRTDSLRA